MSSEPRSVSARRVSEGRTKDSFGSLNVCVVDGDAEQRMGERRIKRRALAVSILLQCAVLAALLLVPLFTKAERISLTIVTPVVPYGRPNNHPPGKPRTPTSRPNIPDRRFTFHPPTNKVNHHPHEDEGPVGMFGDRKSTRLNSSHQIISYAVFCLK